MQFAYHMTLIKISRIQATKLLLKTPKRTSGAIKTTFLHSRAVKKLRKDPCDIFSSSKTMGDLRTIRSSARDTEH